MDDSILSCFLICRLIFVKWSQVNTLHVLWQFLKVQRCILLINAAQVNKQLQEVLGLHEQQQI